LYYGFICFQINHANPLIMRIKVQNNYYYTIFIIFFNYRYFISPPKYVIIFRFMHKKIETKKLLASIFCLTLAVISVLASTTSSIFAATTTPATINYQGRLLDSSNNPLAGNYTFRFSIWNTAGWVAGDTTGGGAINVGSAGYAGWQETHTVTTDTFGLFNMALGDTTPIPNFTVSAHNHLQVEVKPAASPDTSYEILDPSGTLGDGNDRKPINNQPYAVNADYIDNAEIGTGAGNIATLGAGNVFPISTIPGGTNADTFTLDSDNSAGGPVALQFGALLSKILSYIPASSWFNFNDNVNIQGNLTTTGTINGINLSSIPFSNLATRVKQATFAPDFAGATSDTVGGANKGTLRLETDGATKQNYYQWTTDQATIQDIDVVLSVSLPLDFVSFTATPITLLYKTSDGVITTNKVDVTAFDTTGAPITLAGGSNLANPTWTNAPITFGGAPTFTAGEPITIRIKLSATNAGFARVSDLVLNYNGR
jgi:hypothetical protein